MAHNVAETARLRQAIDEIDQTLLSLLNRRARTAIDIGVLKQAAGLPVTAPEREQEVIKNLTAANPGPLADEHIHAIWHAIMSSTKDLQNAIRTR